MSNAGSPLPPLYRNDAALNPIALYQTWRELIGNALEETAVLATVTNGSAGAASGVRFGYLDEGFVFFIGQRSRSAMDLILCPAAALYFCWSALRGHIIVEGDTSKIDDVESDRFFCDLDRGAQLAVWASVTGSENGGRTQETRLNHFHDYFGGQDIPRPRLWGGYRLLPLAMEFVRREDGAPEQYARYERVPSSQTWTLSALNL